MVWNGMKLKFRYGIWKMPEWNEMEDFKNGMKDNLSYFRTNSIQISLMAFTEKYLRLVIPKIVWKRLAANHFSTN